MEPELELSSFINILPDEMRHWYQAFILAFSIVGTLNWFAAELITALYQYASGRSHSRSLSRSPHPYHASRSRYRSRSYSPAPKQRNYSPSPERRYADHLRFPRGPPPEREGGHRCRSYSPCYGRGDDLNINNNGFGKKLAYDFVEARDWRSSHGRPSGSPYARRSRSVDLSPRPVR
ncbi:hypothetical protein OIU79_005056 [Salix purpurea]|uniref:Uncharacterized protein n=1 Tax=Salix purpurea TaxID=77065 RepID=A0A9Q0UBM0_SALPP|nr:hypothetical protein OIU79_005056 [Salix purpurea]